MWGELAEVTQLARDRGSQVVWHQRTLPPPQLPPLLLEKISVFYYSKISDILHQVTWWRARLWGLTDLQSIPNSTVTMSVTLGMRNFSVPHFPQW